MTVVMPHLTFRPNSCQESCRRGLVRKRIECYERASVRRRISDAPIDGKSKIISAATSLHRPISRGATDHYFRAELPRRSIRRQRGTRKRNLNAGGAAPMAATATQRRTQCVVDFHEPRYRPARAPGTRATDPAEPATRFLQPAQHAAYSGILFGTKRLCIVGNAEATAQRNYPSA